MFAWTKQLSIGNRVLDLEHRNLGEIATRIAQSVVDRDVTALDGAFGHLMGCLGAYFALEERIAQAAHFNFGEHRLAHQNLLNELQRTRDELMTRNGKWSDEEGADYAHSIVNCLVHHIREDSRPLKIVLDTHYYDFNP